MYARKFRFDFSAIFPRKFTRLAKVRSEYVGTLWQPSQFAVPEGHFGMSCSLPRYGPLCRFWNN